MILTISIGSVGVINKECLIFLFWRLQLYGFWACGIFAAYLFPISVTYLQNVFEVMWGSLEILLPILNI